MLPESFGSSLFPLPYVFYWRQRHCLRKSLSSLLRKSQDVSKEVCLSRSPRKTHLLKGSSFLRSSLPFIIKKQYWNCFPRALDPPSSLFLTSSYWRQRDCLRKSLSSLLRRSQDVFKEVCLSRSPRKTHLLKGSSLLRSSLPFIIKDHKEVASQSSGSSLIRFPYKFLLKTIRK